jgi:hypothetical protein
MEPPDEPEICRRRARHTRCFLTGTMFRALAICALAAPMPLLAQQAAQVRIEQSRQQVPLPGTIDLDGQRNAPDFPELTDAAQADDAFGAQLILKREERPKYFTGFAEIGAFVTNNVALVNRGQENDAFLVASAGAAWARQIGRGFTLDARLSGSAYRYDRYRALDFQSIDAGAGVTWAPAHLGGVELLLRYAYTNLTSGDGGEEFYKNHAALLGAQKVVAISRAQAAYFGANAQWSWADPKESGRDEYVAYAGYRLAVTRAWMADLYYRYGYYVYREGDGRRDNNHTLALTLRYTPVEWASVSATSFAGFNRSNQDVYDYNVLNLGLGLQVAVRF